MSIVIFLIILSVLVIVHEAGHLWAAKSAGMRVDEFGIGFPPRISKLFSWKGTNFYLNALPFGGYVRIFGENPEEEGASTRGDSFLSKSMPRQILVLLSGVLANFVLAWVLLSIVLMIGILAFDQGFVHYGFFEAIWHGLLTTGKITWLTIEGLGTLLAGLFSGHADLTGVVGPVGLISLTKHVAGEGFVYLLYFTALISVNLSIINLVPLPALDGGRALIVFIEWARGKNISPKVFNAINIASFVLLIILMVLITIRDISHL